MAPGRYTHLPPRIWTVSIRNHQGAACAECRTCGPVRSADGLPPRRAALRHLARHARSDLTPTHLRTCQCARHGCPWHRRHRGCSGPILLALALDPASRAWRLADVCHQCYQATPGTAVVTSAAAPVAAPEGDGARGASTPPEEEPLPWEGDCPPCATCCAFDALRADREIGPHSWETGHRRPPTMTGAAPAGTSV